MIYRFFWDEGKEEAIVQISSSTADAQEHDVIKKLLSEYTSNNSEYNIDDWLEFLKEHGYTVILIEPDYDMYF